MLAVDKFVKYSLLSFYQKPYCFLNYCFTEEETKEETEEEKEELEGLRVFEDKALLAF